MGSDRGYREKADPTPNTVLIRTISDFEGIDWVIYVDFPLAGKIQDLTAAKLASAAIASAQSLNDGRDGISYLKAALENQIETPLAASYFRAICDELGVDSLDNALSRIHAG